MAFNQQIVALMDTVQNKQVPEELSLYKHWLVSLLEEIGTEVEENLHNLKKNKDRLLPIILSQSESISRYISLINHTYVPPIHRSLESDKIGLKLLNWLHLSHEMTQQIPFAISDGAFGIYPTNPTLYYLPATDQKGLLYLPLFFHEFGHLLYEQHKPEMNELVKEIQLGVEELNRPLITHNDERSEENLREMEIIVTTWYKWIQEFFCDAVGLAIGGESYLYAFSNYLQMGGREEFHLSKEGLKGRTHPVTLIRIRLLIQRARKLNYSLAAALVEKEWDTLQNHYIRSTEFYGYYTDEYESFLTENLDNMLIEANPNLFVEAGSSPVNLLKEAWHFFIKNPKNYSIWEKAQIDKFMQMA